MKEYFQWIIYRCIPLFTAIFSGFLILLYKFQNKILYLPQIGEISRSPKDNPQQFQNPSGFEMPYEDIEIKTKDQIILRGWLIHSSKKAQTNTIVFFHENAGNIGTRLPYLNYYYRYTDFNILLVAYRGYSDSDGEPTETGLQIDSVAIIDYIFQRQDIDTSKIFIHGRSLGGAVGIYASYANKKYPIKGLILENTFTNISDMVDSIFPFLKIFKKIILKNFWPSASRIENLNLPILFIMADQDEIVPFSQMVQLYAKANKSNLKDQLLIKNGKHNDSWTKDMGLYFNTIKIFIQKVNNL